MKLRTTTIEQEESIPAAPEAVFDALVEPAKHSDVTGARATGQPRVGERFTAWDGYISGRFVELARGKRIVWEWTTTEWPKGFPPSRVELSLSPSGKGTLLRMVHSGVPMEQAESYRQGWLDFYWEPLKRYFSKK